MGIADKFRDLSQRLPTAINDPMFQLGIQLMQAGGYQQGDPSTGQRLGQAVQGFGQQQAQAQQLAQMQQLNQLRQMQMDQQRQQAASAQQLAERMQDPAFLESLPQYSRQLAQAGASPDQIFDVYRMESQAEAQRRQIESLEQYRQGQLGIQQQRADAYAQRQGQLGQGGGAPAGPKMPNPRQFVDMPQEDGTIQRMQINPQTGQYEPFGAPFARGGSSGARDPLDPTGDVLNPQLAQELSGIPTGPKSAPRPVPGQPGVTSGATPDDLDFTPDGVPIPRYTAPTPPMAAAGGGQQQAQQARVPAGFEADLAQAQRLLQANPQLRGEIDRRLREKYGRGL